METSLSGLKCGMMAYDGDAPMSDRADWAAFLLPARTRLVAALAIVVLSTTAPLAQEVKISDVGHFTENRGPNEAGIHAAYQVVVTAAVVPSDFPTRVFAEQAGVRQAMWLLPVSAAPNAYVYLRRLELGLTGSWRIVAELGEGTATAWTPVLAKPQEVPLVRNAQVTGRGAEPLVTWEVPDLTRFDVDRIRVGIRGGKRLYERFLDLVYVSGDLSPTATAFLVPPGVLALGERYIFQVMLEDLEGGVLANRSVTFSEPYTVSR
jgi:hypothetical protein